MKERISFLFRWESALVLVLIAQLIVFSSLNPRFGDPTRLLTSTVDFVYLGIVALPLAAAMMSGGIDISFGSVASLAAIVTGVVYQTWGSIWLGLLVALVVATLAGGLNALLIITTAAQPMVITLGTQFLFAGLALGASGLGGVSAFEGISGLPDAFVRIGSGRLGNVPHMLIIFLAIAAIFALLMNHSVYGRQVRLMGSNPRAARYAGISAPKVIAVTYMLSGLCAGIVGVLLTSYLSSARADIGGALLMPTLTLVVIGGISMYGGEGSIFGVIVATFVIGFLQQGLRFQGMTESQVSVMVGAALVIVASVRWWTARGSEIYKNREVRRAIGKGAAHRAAQGTSPGEASTP